MRNAENRLMAMAIKPIIITTLIHMIVTRWLAFIPVIVALATLYGLCQLGFWQLDRAAQKQALIERHQQRSLQPPTDLSSLLSRNSDVNDFPLKITGHFHNEQSVLLDNRILNGKAGFNVLTPFETDDHLVLVDRGWLPATGDRSHLPTIPQASDTIIAGTAYVPNPDIFTLKDDNYTTTYWPLLVQKVELEKLAPLFDKPLAPLVLRLTSETTSPLQRDVPLQTLDPERNYGYAFQWFSMALAVFFIALHFLLKKFRQNNIKNHSALTR